MIAITLEVRQCVRLEADVRGPRSVAIGSDCLRRAIILGPEYIQQPLDDGHECWATRMPARRIAA